MSSIQRTCCLFAAALTAAIPLAAPASGQDAPALFNNRWSEDWSHAPADLAYKNIVLGDGFALDLGADARWKGETISAPRFGLTSQSDDSWLQQRLMVNANLRYGDAVRAFVELGAFDVIDRAFPGSNDDDRLDLQQGFLEVSPDLAGARLHLRVGRQEMEYAGDRFFDLGDSSNIRQHFDAARAWYEHGPWRIDAFSGTQVRNLPGVFDDHVIDGQDIYGFQIDHTAGGVRARAFLIDFSREAFAIAGASANERRRTLGFSLKGVRGPYDFDAEIVRQFGTFGTEDVRAWGGALEMGRRFADRAWRPRLGIRFTYGSGDSDPNDNVQETYAPPLARGSWFSEGGFSSLSNIFEAAALGDIKPRADLTVAFKLSGLWRPESADFVYASPHVALPGTRGGDSFIGLSPNIAINWNLSRHVTVRGQAVYVDVSDRIEAAGGQNAAYGNVSLALRY